MDRIQKTDKFVYRVAEYTSLVGFVGAIFLMVLNVVDIIGTKIFSAPIIGAYEISQYVLLCTIFSVFAYAQVNKKHINMTIFITHFARPVKLIIYGALQALSTVITVILAIAAFVQTGVDIESNKISDVLYFPIWPFMVVEGVCMVIFAFTLAWDTILAFMALKNDEAYQMVTSTWD